MNRSHMNQQEWVSELQFKEEEVSKEFIQYGFLYIRLKLGKAQ